jgi:ABC-type branched-subunit amino acid transport system ATPase component
MTSPALSVRGLNKRFGGLVVAQSIDLDLMPGARVGLIRTAPARPRSSTC